MDSALNTSSISKPAPIITFAFWPLFVRYNYGISMLSSILAAWGIECRMVMLDLYDSVDDFTPDTDYVGFSCTTEDEYAKCVPYIRRAKALDKIVLLGGVWAGLNKPVDGCVDYVCRGDGEGLPGYILGSDTSIFDSSQVTTDLDALPLPDYSMWRGIPFGDRGIPYLRDKSILPYSSSRGCPHHCTFCQIRHQPPGHRIRRNVAADLQYLLDLHHPDIIYFLDAQTPYYDSKWRGSWGDFHHPFVCYIRADATQYELEFLIEHGMVGCAFGVESGDEEYRNNTLSKSVTDTQIQQTIWTLGLHNVFYIPFFMGGLPNDTFLTRTRTVRMMRDIGGMPMAWNYTDLTA